MADTSQAGVPFVELTDEEKAVLRECRTTSIFFRGFPLGVVSVLALRQAIKYGVPIPGAKRFSGIYYTVYRLLLSIVLVKRLFGFGFLTGIASYQSACVEKIMKLENSRLADQVRARMTAEGRGAYQRQWQTGNVHHEQQDADLQGKSWSGNQFGEARPPMEDYIPPSVSATSSVESSEEAPPPPSLYFDVDKAKEDKYTSYAELRKKHRERWTPPNMSSSGPNRPEQPRRTQQREPDSRAGSSDAPLSWFDRDDNDDERSNQESSREFGQRSYTRPSYRQGPPPKKNKYGDLIEG